MKARTNRTLWMLEYYITMHAKVHMTCGGNDRRLLHIIASPCFWQFRGNWLKQIPKLLGQSCQCRCLLHTSQEYNKIRNFYCHQILFFTGDCTSDVSSRCSVSVSQQFLENYETNQPVTTLCTSHFSFTPTHHPTPTHTHTHSTTTACLSPLVLYFQHPKFDETCPNAAWLCCQQYWVGFKKDISFNSLNSERRKGRLCLILLQQHYIIEC